MTRRVAVAQMGASDRAAAATSLAEAPDASLVDAIAAVAARSPRNVAIAVPGGRTTTYAELLERVGDATNRYRALGLAEAKRVALLSPATVDTIVALLALARIATVVPLNPAYTTTELRGYLETARANALVVTRESAGLGELADELAIPTVRPTTVDIARAAGRPLSQNGRPAALLFQTSGTTARPKNVPLSHRNVLAGADNVVRALGLTAEDSCLVMMPLHHVHGLIGCALATLLCGGRLILPSTPRAVEAFGWLETEKATWYSGSPAVHHAMVARARTAHGGPRHALRILRSASAPLPMRLIQDLRETFGAAVVNAYGMTEGSHQIASTSLDGCEQDGDVGLPVGCEVMARREDGSRADPGEAEEIWIRGENVTAGYEPADESVDADGWLRTGDVGTVDARGRVRLIARKKELINKGGQKISPAEIDAALLTIPGVVDAGTFAISDARLGEDVAAAIVARSGSTLLPDEIRAGLARQLASFKVPSRIFMVEELPKGPTGKLLRRRLAESLSAPLTPEPASRGEAAPWSIEDALGGLWKEVLQIDRVALEDDFFELGGDSLSAAELVLRVSERFGNEPSLTSFFAAPTVAAMAGSISGRGVAPRGAARALVPLRAEGTEAPLFLVHGTAFSVDHYRTLVSQLRADVPVFGVQEDLFRTPPYVPPDLPTLARHYVEVMRTQQTRGPYRLGGYSSGGVLAAEMANVLLAAGEAVEPLLLIDAYPLWLWGTWAWSAYRLRTLRRLSGASRARWLYDVIRARVRRARQGAAARRGDLGRSIAERVSRLSSNMERIVAGHRPATLDVPVAFLVTAEAQALWGDPQLHWKAIAPRLTTVVVPGTHYEVLEEPHAAETARALGAFLGGQADGVVRRA